MLRKAGLCRLHFRHIVSFYYNRSDAEFLMRITQTIPLYNSLNRQVNISHNFSVSNASINSIVLVIQNYEKNITIHFKQLIYLYIIVRNKLFDRHFSDIKTL